MSERTVRIIECDLCSSSVRATQAAAQARSDVPTPTFTAVGDHHLCRDHLRETTSMIRNLKAVADLLQVTDLSVLDEEKP